MAEERNKVEEEIRQRFDRWDTDGNGTLNWEEFCSLLDELVEDLSLEEKTIAYHLVDTNHTGLISFEEFSAWWHRRVGD